MIKIPAVGTKIKVKTRYRIGPMMIPPRADFNEYEGTVIRTDAWLKGDLFCMTGDKEFPVRTINAANVLSIEVVGQESIKEEQKEKTAYTQELIKGRWTCTCTGFKFRKTCKHVKEKTK